jgi:hypothetical protein
VPVRVVRVAHVVNLEAERVLQEIARLLGLQAGHDGRPFTDVYDLEGIGLGQHAGDIVYLLGSRHPVRACAEFELTQRADVAEFTDAIVTIVVRQIMRIGHRARGLPEQGR